MTTTSAPLHGRTDTDAKKATANGKPCKVWFGDGLHLFVTPAGTKSWRTKYRRDGKGHTEVLGRWPDMKLDEARTARREILKVLIAGGSPKAERMRRRATARNADAMTVEAVAASWIKAVRSEWSEGYAPQVAARLANHVFPILGQMPIASVSTMQIENLLRGMLVATKDRKALPAQAVHVRHHLQGLFDYATAHHLTEENTVRRIGRYLPKRKLGAGKSRDHVESIEDARKVLAAFEATRADPMLKLAHRFLALTGTRKLETVEAEWSEIDLDAATWTIPAGRMKGRRGAQREHVVPLSSACLDVLRTARVVAKSWRTTSRYVFPSADREPFNRCAMNELLERALAPTGLKHVPHGWRSTFSTILNEADPLNFRIIDVALAHKAFGDVEALYNKAEFLEQRRRLSEHWSSLLLDGAPSAMAVAGYTTAETTTENVIQLAA